MSEGIDFADDAARCPFATYPLLCFCFFSHQFFPLSLGPGVIVISLPLPQLMDLRVSLKRKYLDKKRQTNRDSLSGAEWYNQQAIRAVNQSIGRVIRHRYDFGCAILLDDRFESESKKLSRWLLPYHRCIRQFSLLMQHLSQFFRSLSDAQYAVKRVKVDPIVEPSKEELRSGSRVMIGLHEKSAVRTTSHETTNSQFDLSAVPSVAPNGAVFVPTESTLSLSSVLSANPQISQRIARSTLSDELRQRPSNLPITQQSSSEPKPRNLRSLLSRVMQILQPISLNSAIARPLYQSMQRINRNVPFPKSMFDIFRCLSSVMSKPPVATTVILNSSGTDSDDSIAISACICLSAFVPLFPTSHPLQSPAATGFTATHLATLTQYEKLSLEHRQQLVAHRTFLLSQPIDWLVECRHVLIAFLPNLMTTERAPHLPSTRSAHSFAEVLITFFNVEPSERNACNQYLQRLAQADATASTSQSASVAASNIDIRDFITRVRQHVSPVDFDRFKLAARRLSALSDDSTSTSEVLSHLIAVRSMLAGDELGAKLWSQFYQHAAPPWCRKFVTAEGCVLQSSASAPSRLPVTLQLD